MNFQIKLPIKFFEQKLNYKHKLLFVGSCFAENIGELMSRYKFSVLSNPNGILYNPKSIVSSIDSYIENKKVHEADLFYANECWNTWEHHSRFSKINKDECLQNINNQIEEAYQELKNADWLFITLGSAFVYWNKDSKKYVANCHKVAQDSFTKKMILSDEIVSDFELLFEKLKTFNPKLKIVFTISPVRYIRDGVIENNLSKAQLISAVHILINEFDNVFYFPAYEIVIDELRDYRFYKSDMVHPNEQAVEYVFEKLKTTMFDIETEQNFEKIKSIYTSILHKPFNNGSESYKKFKAKLRIQSDELKTKLPFVDFDSELQKIP